MIGMLKGLATTLSTFTRKTVTIEYPEEKHPLPVRQRSFPVLTWDFDHNEPCCTGCNICVRNCPVDCMTAVMHDNPQYPAGTSNRRKVVEKFWIDYARCMRCNICVEVCPFEAIVMDNNWSGHEHAVYDRRDLHMDIDELTRASREGTLSMPFRPQDRIELIEKVTAGQEPPEPAFKESLPSARQAQLDRIARGESPAIQEREPEKPKAGAARAGAGGAGGEEVEILSERKLRARRMKAEREVQAYIDRGEDVPAEAKAALEKYRNMKPGVPAGGAAAPAAAAAPAEGGAGDPNSPRKMRARRMKAERAAKEALDAGQEIPEDVMATLIQTGSEMAPADAVAAAQAAAAAATAGGGDDEGGLSDRKLRARRMRASRQAKEAIAAGEPVPDDVAAILAEFNITVESLQSGD
jgi:NADH-quinone oxidoreductase subunit I